MHYVSRFAGMLLLCLVVSGHAATPLFIEKFALINRSVELKGFNHGGDLLVTLIETNSTGDEVTFPAVIRGGSVLSLKPVGTPNITGLLVDGLSEVRADGGLFVAGTAIMGDGFWRAALWDVSASGSFTFKTMPNIVLPSDSSAPGEQERSLGFAVNRAGVLVGTGDSYLAGLATIWRPPYTTIEHYLLSTGSSFDAINDDGLLLANGVEFDHGNSNNRLSAAITVAGGIPQEVPLLPDVVKNWLYPSQANAMSGEWICGYNHTVNGTRAFAWRIGTSASIDLPNPPGVKPEDAQITDAPSINSFGHVVGYLNGGAFSMRPILWHYENGTHTPYFLNDLLPAEEFGNHVIEQSVLINDSNEIAFVERGSGITHLRVYEALTNGFVEFVFEGVGANEEDGQVQFKVKLTRSRGNNGPVAIRYATVDDTALAGRDYLRQEGTLTWAAGEAGEKSIVVPLIDNLTLDETRFFKVRLSDVSGARLGSRSESMGYIGEAYQQFDVRNQMAAGWRYGCAVVRGQSQVVLKVQRLGGSDGAISFSDFQVIDAEAQRGIDYELPQDFQLSWKAGESGTKTLVLPLLNTDEPITEPRAFSLIGTGRFEGTDIEQQFMVSVIILARAEDARPVIDSSAIQKLLDGFSVTVAAVQGALVELEQTVGALNSGWVTAAQAVSHDGEVRLQARINTDASRQRFYRVKVGGN